MKAIFSAVDMLYPGICPVCGQVLSFAQPGGRKVHPSCAALLRRIRPPFCLKCGTPLPGDREEYCPVCAAGAHSFESGRGLWLYDAAGSEAVFSFKYGNRREAAAFFASSLAQGLGGYIRSFSPDMIVPVPLSREKLRQRGYNQSLLIAGLLGEQLGIPAEPRALGRLRGTSPQKGLGKGGRQENLRTAFRADPRFIPSGSRILLLDDIYTTGTTMEFCARALRKAGAGRIRFVVLCRGASYGEAAEQAQGNVGRSGGTGTGDHCERL